MVPISDQQEDTLSQLKLVLQKLEASQFERLAAGLIGELLDLPIAIARSGFQHGGDGGPAGRAGRRFRIETKRYADGSKISSRELLGEVDHAIMRDPALEAWFLIATREAPEQLEMDLQRKSQTTGVPIIVIDWKVGWSPALAVLCCASPELVGEYLGAEAREIVSGLIKCFEEPLEKLRRELQAWSPGFLALRDVSQSALHELWTNRRRALASFGQDVAGGQHKFTIRRQDSFDKLQTWWDDSDARPSPAVLTGFEGYGKTWAALGWVLHARDQLPVILIIPSSKFVGLRQASQASLLRLLAEECVELTHSGDVEFWHLRLERLLQRPDAEGPVACVLIDGMNQESSTPWRRLFQVLQDTPFAGKIRIVATTRTHHFEDRLRCLSNLPSACTKIEVDQFSDNPGGELDQMLHRDGLSRSDLPVDLVPLARTPRLYSLVIKLRESLDSSSEVTVHRLLWEYGRDTWSERTERAFSENEWKSALRSIAQDFRNGIEAYDTHRLAELAARSDLGEVDVYRRLSDLVDGRFLVSLPSGRYKLSEQTVAFSLGAALLFQLLDSGSTETDVIETILADWLDPIAGLDQRADILRAAVNIMLTQEQMVSGPLAGQLVTSWLSTQNLPPSHRREVKDLAQAIVHPLLDVLERDPFSAYKAARFVALDALRDLPKNAELRDIIVQRANGWLRMFDRGIDGSSRRHQDVDKHRADHLIKRVGRDADGKHTVLGVELDFVGGVSNPAVGDIPALLDGHELAGATSVFEKVVIVEALSRSHVIWEELKWVLLLNERDFAETARALEQLSSDFLRRVPEDGVHPEFPARVAALLLWLSGDDCLEMRASEINPPIDSWRGYVAEYEDDPATSLYRLERRHVHQVLAREDIALWRRIDRAKHFWKDPTLSVPDQFIAELTEAATQFDVDQLCIGLSRTRADHDLKELALPLARFAPEALAQLMRRAFTPITPLAGARRIAVAHQLPSLFVVHDNPMAEALKYRHNGSESSDDRAYIAERALLLEIADLDCSAQFKRLIEAKLEHFSYDPGKVLKHPSTAELDELIAWARAMGPKAEKDLVILLSIVEADFSSEAWNWLLELALSASFESSGVAFKTLSRADGEKLGRVLLEKNWTWAPSSDAWVNHYGSHALIEASQGLSLEQIASRITPSLLPFAVRARGGETSDVAIAVDILDGLLLDVDVGPIDPGGDISIKVDRVADDPEAFSIQPPSLYGDGLEGFFREMANPDEVEAHRSKVVETAVARIREARSKGARLYLNRFDSVDFDAFVTRAPMAVDRWIEGFEGPSDNFRKRVNQAEGVYLALCEALMRTNPARGVALWRGLRQAMHVRYIGRASIEDRIHVLFRNADAPEVGALLDELLELEQTNSDEELFEWALAAQLNGRRDWLEGVIRDDASSPHIWRRQRGQVLSGFLANNTQHAETGEDSIADHAPMARIQKMHSWRFREACAYFWWDRYWEASTAEEAYAAWTLFIRTADRRAYCWMRERIAEVDSSNALDRRKLAHFRLSADRLDREMKQQEKDLNREFLRRRQGSDVGPWRKVTEE